ncbi:hypothetical protein VP01_8129g1, partial [Puccinia sorghi]
MLHLQHSPKGLAMKLPANELEPEAPQDGVSYSKGEIAAMSGKEHQWLICCQHLIKGEDLDLIDYKEDTTTPVAKDVPDKKPSIICPAGPADKGLALLLRQETN